MRRWGIWTARLGLLLLPLLSWAQGSPAALHRLVRLAPGRQPLGAVLAEIARQSQLPFSYSSSLVPLAHPCYLPPGPPRPAAAVLREVLSAEHLSYGLLNGQLVLWPDHVAAPVGVVAVNGRAVPAASRHSLSALKPSPVAGVFGQSITINRPASRAANGQPPGLPARPAKQSLVAASKLTKRAAAAPGGQKASVARASPLGLRPSLAAPKQPRPATLTRAKPTSSPGRQMRRVALPAGTASAKQRLTGIKTIGNQIFTKNTRPQTAAIAPAATQRPAPPNAPLSRADQTRLAGSPRPAYLGRGPVAELLPRSAEQAVAVGAASELPPPGLPDSLAAVPLSPASSELKSESVPLQSPVAEFLPWRLSLHGEAWGSESLPINSAVKVGWPRIYLVMSVAAVPFDHHGGVAWGVGLGTLGRARGRFTPSLDLLHWVITGDGRGDETAQGQLTQLRPLLAWQLKPGSRWQLVGGPTLNLATAPREVRGSQPSGPGWTLGQGQWLWLDTSDERSGGRLWPGVQVGLRF